MQVRVGGQERGGGPRVLLEPLAWRSRVGGLLHLPERLSGSDGDAHGAARAEDRGPAQLLRAARIAAERTPSTWGGVCGTTVAREGRGRPSESVCGGRCRLARGGRGWSCRRGSQGARARGRYARQLCRLA